MDIFSHFTGIWGRRAAVCMLILPLNQKHLYSFCFSEFSTKWVCIVTFILRETTTKATVKWEGPRSPFLSGKREKNHVWYSVTALTRQLLSRGASGWMNQRLENFFSKELSILLVLFIFPSWTRNVANAVTVSNLKTAIKKMYHLVAQMASIYQRALGMDSGTWFFYWFYLESLMHFQSTGSRWLRLPVWGLAGTSWGRRGDWTKCLLSSQRLVWACSHGDELQDF